MNPKSMLVSTKSPSTLVRPKYSQGLLLNDDDLTQAVDYTRDLSRLLFRSLLGCGVICGLAVDNSIECNKLLVKVAMGVALDCHGDPVHVPTNQSISFDPQCGADAPTKLWVLLRRYQKFCAARSTVCGPEDDDPPSVCTRVHEGFEIALTSELPECVCACIKPEKFPPDLPATDTTKAARKAGKATASDTGVVGDAQTPAYDCYTAHRQGVCACGCAGCDCEWVVLAQLDAPPPEKGGKWTVDHTIRRFIRPALLPDPWLSAPNLPKP